MTERNPWVAASERVKILDLPTDGAEQPSGVSASPRIGDHVVVGDAVAIQAGVRLPGDGPGLLPLVPVPPIPGIWVVGAHGGSGESTLAAQVDAWEDTDHSWPTLTAAQGRCLCVLVARTNVTGLRAAQRALTQWAAGAVGPQTTLAGLVLIADAPGRLPRPLRDLAAHVAGGAPRTWQLGWSEAWRLGELPTPSERPRDLRGLITDLDGLLAVTGTIEERNRP